MNQLTIAALKIERRSIAVAVFSHDERLDYTQVRQLSSDPQQAQASAVRFLNWIINTFEIGCCAVEQQIQSLDTRRSLLTETIIRCLREAAIPVWQVTKADLLASFGVPALRSRTELRRVIRSIWPILDERTQDNGILDAAALGLYVVTEKAFASAA